MLYIIKSTVDDVYHFEPTVRVDKDGTEHKADYGWFIKLRGSYEAIHVGDEKPLMEAGDAVEITIRKVP